MGREQSIYRHPGFLLFRQWGSANTGPLHVTGMDNLTSKTASPREGKAVGEWPSGDENEALWSMPTMLPPGVLLPTPLDAALMASGTCWAQ